MALLTDLFEHWKLDETSDGSSAVSRAGAFASKTLTDVNTCASIAAALNNGCRFTNSGEKLTRVSEAGFQMAGISFALACWFKAASFAGGCVLLDKDISGFGYSLNVTTTGFAQFNVRVSTVQSASALSTNTLYFILGQHDTVNNQLQLYINNVAETPVSFSNDPVDTSTDFVMGGGNGSNDFWVDEASIWRGIKSVADIAALWNSGAPLPFASWDAGGGAGSLIGGKLTESVLLGRLAK